MPKRGAYLCTFTKEGIEQPEFVVIYTCPWRSTDRRHEYQHIFMESCTCPPNALLQGQWRCSAVPRACQDRTFLRLPDGLQYFHYLYINGRLSAGNITFVSE
ncbi:hypothetical protein NDU88_002534 [Pleurodeles waltl]|uniref:Uncharacterized protein n=1 Tax=Pleurodeles waltl TaxID=8319 RepID=A0AAV7T343_PLEWA|nr:hypothetical protein NDU88_002534 [Pleurodeles waltl]